jgi:K+-transporting ATPase ATPase C chain
MRTIKEIIIALKALLLFTILLGLVYPLFVWLIGQFVFPRATNGSLIEKNGKIIGSTLIAQKFTSDKYFRARPSSIDYNPFPSGASNYGLTNTQLKADFLLRSNLFKQQNYIAENETLPSEMLFTSASGVDPHISKQAVLLQVNRVAKFRSFDSNKKAKLLQVIDSLSQKSVAGILGEEIVNVLELNLKLDMIK